MQKFLPFLLLFGLQTAFSQSFKVIGYLPTYRFSWLNDIEFGKLTHVNIAFANPDSLGNLSCGGVSITAAVNKAHQAGCQVYISLAGGYLDPAVDGYWNNLTLPANRAAFIQKIVQYVQAQNLDGVDVDLEWQYIQTWYSPFILELKAALTPLGKPLTVALPGSYRYPEITAAALSAFDWVNMMVYDLTGPWDPTNPGQHSPYPWAQQCIQYWKNQGVP
ncbi:MAG: glycosyl hydrolase family 18 protein, partial [Saprospiraceae bacterium]